MARKPRKKVTPKRKKLRKLTQAATGLAQAMRYLGYTNDQAQDGLDKVRFGGEFGVSYHAVRLWLNGTNPVPAYVARFIEDRQRMKRSGMKIKPRPSLTSACAEMPAAH